MGKISLQVRNSFIYLQFGETGYGFYINQLEAFGEILFKSGSIVEFDPASSTLKSSDGNESINVPIHSLLHQYLGPSIVPPSSNSIDTSTTSDCMKSNVEPLADELTLSDIAGLHRKVRLAMRKTSGLSRDLLPLSSDEVMDFLRVFPITLVKEQDKNTCVLGIYSYLLASSHIKSSKKVPVRWYTGKMGIPLQRLIMIELLTLPFALGLNKRQYQTFLNYVKPAFDDLYKNSFFNSHHSEKHIATHLGIDERTLKKEPYDA